MDSYGKAAIGILTTFMIIILSTVFMPMVLFNPKASGHGNDYTIVSAGDPHRGRQIYVREGCFYCHSQFTRLQDRGYGPLVHAGDFTRWTTNGQDMLYEVPHVLGTARTGPDLTNEGGRMSSQWQKAHLINPRAVKPGSIMPSFSHLSDRDMNDLVAYIQALGNGRTETKFVQAPDEYLPTTDSGRALLARKHSGLVPDTSVSAAANAGRGIYTQNCAVCHGLEGYGNGPNAITLEKKPANFSRPFYKQYADEFWFYRITEGVPGTRMPHFGEVLTEDQRWYLVAYLKTLPKDKEVIIDTVDQLNKVEPVKLPTLTEQQYEPHTGGGG